MTSLSSLSAICRPPSPSVRASFPARMSSVPDRRRVSGSSSSRCCRFRINCSYAEAGASSPIDIVADVKTERIVVLGGNGFVGSAICKAAVSKGIEVFSLNRSGRPSYPDAWVDQVTWITGDVFYAKWDDVLVGATAVVSTIGGFGSEEQMQRINGEANVAAVTAAKEYGIVLRPGLWQKEIRRDRYSP